MKIDGLTHPKTKELAFTLEIPLPHAIGLLELMWAFVGQQTPRGNIGKWSNAVIASEAGWTDDPELFISALLSVGFLDEDETHRLLVHDWHEHCPNWVHAKLKKKKQSILRADLSPDLRAGQEGSIEGATSLAKPSQAKPSQATAGKTTVEPAKRGLDRGDEIREVFTYWRQELNHPQAKLDDKRRTKIRMRLEDGYTVGDLCRAIDGIQKSPHHMGENDRATVYDDIELICRDAKHVDTFIRFAGGPDLTAMSSAARQTAHAAADWLEEDAA